MQFRFDSLVNEASPRFAVTALPFTAGSVIRLNSIGRFTVLTYCGFIFAPILVCGLKPVHCKPVETGCKFFSLPFPAVNGKGYDRLRREAS